MKEYKQIITMTGAFLKGTGWSKTNDTFYKENDNNWGLINFQKSASNTSNYLKFTINIGISSTALRKFDDYDLSKKPSIENCHWRIRIGQLFEPKEDFWWTIIDQTSIDDIILQITRVFVELAIPKIERLISDESLKELWLSGMSDGLTELQRLINLTTLMKLNNDNNLQKVVQELNTYSKGKSFETIARSHIRTLGFSYN